MSHIVATDQDFEEKVLKNSKPVLVDFWADWCGPCKMLEPIIDEVAKELGDKVQIAKVDVDANQQTAQKYNILSIPTVRKVRNLPPGNLIEKGLQERALLR